MSEAEVTAYNEAQAEPKRSTLLEMRRRILAIEPGLEQVIAWNSPQFKFNGKYAVGLRAFKNHLTFSPQSADVMEAHAAQLTPYVVSKSPLQFDVDKLLPEPLIRSLLEARLKELGA